MLLASALGGCAAPAPIGPSAGEMAEAMARQPIVILGEVHDNVAQHALRAAALRVLVERGARPAIAMEQLDGDRQQALLRARENARGALDARADALIQAAGARGWQWKLYRPYLELALEYDLPIVAANLSRAQAMRVAQEGLAAVFDERQQAELGIAEIPDDIEQAQEREIEEGHCGRVPREALPAMAHAQVARDAMLARSILPYAERGVVLLTGNGHARRDIGVLRHLPESARSHAITIGLLEDDAKAAELAGAFDVVYRTAVQARPDPCTTIGPMPAMPATAPVQDGARAR